MAFFAAPMANWSSFWRTKPVTREAWMQTIRVAPLICQVFKRIMGLARIERAKPIVVQMFDVVVTAEDHYYGRRVALPTPNPVPLPGPTLVWVVQTCCAPGPT